MADVPKEKPDLMLEKIMNSHGSIQDPPEGGRTSHNRKPLREDAGLDIPTPQPSINFNQKRIPKSKSSYQDPSTASTFDEQVLFIASDLASRVERGNFVSATTFTYEWIDGIVDPKGILYEPVKDELMSLDKRNLVEYLGYILGSIR